MRKGSPAAFDTVAPAPPIWGWKKRAATLEKTTRAENDDHNPPRIASRNLFDVSVGHDNLFHFRGDKYKVSAQLTVINLTNKYALYNFLSTFSGTHYVSPRAITAQLGFHF